MEVVGYWMTLDIQTLKYEAPNQLITLKAGRDSPTIGKKGNITAGLLEELVSKTGWSKIDTHWHKITVYHFQFDSIFIDEKNLVPSRYIRTRFVKFKVGVTTLNQEALEAGEEEEQEMSLRVEMEVQFAKPEDKPVMTLDDFKVH